MVCQYYQVSISCSVLCFDYLTVLSAKVTPALLSLSVRFNRHSLATPGWICMDFLFLTEQYPSSVFNLVIFKMLTHSGRQLAMRLCFVVISGQLRGIVWHDNKWSATKIIWFCWCQNKNDWCSLNPVFPLQPFWPQQWHSDSVSQLCHWELMWYQC